MRRLRLLPQRSPGTLQLQDGSRVAVIGGGPAGSMFSYFLLDAAHRLDLKLELDIYEPRDFTLPGPAGCNMCGGIVSESLVQNLAAEGINLPPSVVQRGIDSYELHMDVGDVHIETPLHEKRIAAIHRGAGPRGIREINKCGLDQYLLQLAQAKGARVVRARVDGALRKDGHIWLKTQKGDEALYDLLVPAIGVNSSSLKIFHDLVRDYRPPTSTKTYICEFCLGRDLLQKHFGSSMHVFLLNLPRLEFAALIPKGEFLTLCLLGHDIDKELIAQFLGSAEVRACMPPGWQVPADFCHCSPKISIRAAMQPYDDGIVFVGDCGATRLYKDGVGAAYRTAKAAAVTAAFDGISAEDFRRNFWPTCADIAHDNQIGKIVFFITRNIQHSRILRRGMWRMVRDEQQRPGAQRRMSSVLWDTFTGSAPYRDIFLRALRPAFLTALAWQTARGFVPEHPPERKAA